MILWNPDQQQIWGEQWGVDVRWKEVQVLQIKPIYVIEFRSWEGLLKPLNAGTQFFWVCLGKGVVHSHIPSIDKARTRLRSPESQSVRSVLGSFAQASTVASYIQLYQIQMLSGIQCLRELVLTLLFQPYFKLNRQLELVCPAINILIQVFL